MVFIKGLVYIPYYFKHAFPDLTRDIESMIVGLA